jgi:acyl dehydratase
MSWSVGHEFTEKTFTVNRSDLKQYADASGDQNPIHQDEAFAQSVGLPNVIAHGMYTMALAGEAIRNWVGSEKSLTEFSTRFAKPVVVPAGEDVPLTFTGKISAIEGDQIIIDVTATCNGVKVLTQTKARVQL